MPAARKPPRSQATWPTAARLLALVLLLGVTLAVVRLVATPADSAPQSASECVPPEGLHVIFCGVDLLAVTAEPVPAPPGRVPPYGEVRVVNARPALAAAERSHFILQSWVDVRRRTSMLRYVEAGAEFFIKLLYDADAPAVQQPRSVLLLGLGAGALPTALRRLCDERAAGSAGEPACASLRLTAVDASADALHITRTFVLRDDGVRLRYVHDTAERFVAAAAAQVAAGGPRPGLLARLRPSYYSSRGAGGPPYDLVVNDAYAGAVGVARDVAFLRHAAAALRPGRGVYCVNALSTGADEGARSRAEAAMGAVFGDDAVRAEVEDDTNAWLCATAPPTGIRL